MATRVLLTVDTELTWRHHAAGLSWRDNFARSCEAAGVGIAFQLERLAAHGLKACFFVDPMPALIHGPEPVRAMVAPILAAGQEVQLHIHPFWHDLAEGRSSPRFELTDFDRAGQTALIARARDLLVAAGAPPPVAFRSGSYAANADTLAALAALGLRYDSSHNGSHHPWPSALPIDPARVAPLALGDVIELPVSQIGGKGGALRHMQLCALSIRELRAALAHAAHHRHPLVTIVSHSFELATRSGLRANKLVVRRFEKLLSFLAAHREGMPTVHCTDLGDLPCDREALPLAHRPLLAAQRRVEQLWSNVRYERPDAALTAATGSSVAGLEILVPFAGL